MKSALVHFEPAQKQRLTQRARRRGKSFSQEVRNAVDLYLTVPVEAEEELSGLASAARRSAERTLKLLDGAIAVVHRVLKNKGSRKPPGKSGAPRPFVRRRGDAYYLVCKVRHKGRVRQLSLAKLGERPRITRDVIRQVSRTYPLLNLDWIELCEQINKQFGESSAVNGERLEKVG